LLIPKIKRAGFKPSQTIPNKIAQPKVEPIQPLTDTIRTLLGTFSRGGLMGWFRWAGTCLYRLFFFSDLSLFKPFRGPSGDLGIRQRTGHVEKQESQHMFARKFSAWTGAVVTQLANIDFDVVDRASPAPTPDRTLRLTEFHPLARLGQLFPGSRGGSVRCQFVDLGLGQRHRPSPFLGTSTPVKFLQSMNL
jgi:hypothetical protein